MHGVSESTVHAERCGDENQGVHPVLEDAYLLDIEIYLGRR